MPPFSFSLSSGIFADGDRQIRNYEEERFWQVLRVNGKLVLATIEEAGTVDNPEVNAELKSDRPITAEDKKRAEEAVNTLFHLDLDLKSFYETVRNDKIGLKTLTTPIVFEALVDSIVMQQISLKVANSLEVRIIRVRRRPRLERRHLLHLSYAKEFSCCQHRRFSEVRFEF